MTGLAVLSDAPVTCRDDLLEFTRYVDPLVSLLVNPQSRTPFTIGVLGAWGSGKSSILTMVDERLADENPSGFVRVHFNPWVHRDEPNMLVPLLHALRDTLLEHRQFAEVATKISAILGVLAADALLSAVTVGRVTLEKFDAAKKRYADERNLVKSEVRGLRGMLRDELGALEGQGVRVVFFVDDIDRCEPDQIVDLLESIKLFLDVPGVFVVMAISKELVDRGVAIKYQGYGFDAEGLVDLGDEYLEKMIQLPLYLLPLDRRGVRRLLASSASTGFLAGHGELLEAVLVPNPRKIKRVLNFLTVTASIVADTPGLTELRGDLIVRLAVLRVQAPRLFAAVLADPRVLVVMEQLYRDELQFHRDTFSARYGADAGKLLFDSVGSHYRRQPQLEPLFTTSAFGEEESRLLEYLTLFGGVAA